jgi:alkylation response protein AidB-like acyl-CoA dehydrogenase
VALYNAAPAIIHAGTPEQKQRYLPGMLQGELWCQGFSEPNAGSDLASLQTRAMLDGDRYIVNGQKVWTSGAAHADFCILLARTDPDAPKTRGISFFAMDMRSPGVEVRPIKNIVGGAEFYETFLTDVEIPVEHRIGPENEGWRVSQATLGSERAIVLVGLAELLRRNGRDLLNAQVAGWTMPDGSPAIEDRAVRQTLARLYGDVEILRLLLQRQIANLIRHGGAGPEASVSKIYYSELLMRLMRFGAELEGLPSAVDRKPAQGTGWESGWLLHDFLHSYSWTIGGGTNEIMRNIVGEQVLGLGREPRPEGAKL